MSFLTDLRFALRSLSRVKGLTFTVVLTLALGIGANAAIFSLVRGVLLRPLVNRDEDRLIYIRQSAKGIGADNAAFSVPELQDLKDGVKSVGAFGDFSAISFTMVGLGEPRVVRAGVVGGSYFDVMGLRPVLGRLLDATRRRTEGGGRRGADPIASGRRRWAAIRTVIGKTIRLGDRAATIVGVLEPSVPYPSETEIIANVVTSPHHLSATMVTGRVHRMTELFGRLAPGADLESAARRAAHGARRDGQSASRVVSAKADFRIDAVRLRDQITSPARTVLLVLLAASALVFVIACSNVANLILARSVRREGELAIRAALGAEHRRAAAHAARREPAAVRRRRDPRRARSRGRWCRCWRGTRRASRCARSTSRSMRACCGSASASRWPRRCCWRSFRGCPPPKRRTDSACRTAASGSRRARTGGCGCLRSTQIAASFVLLAGAGMLLTTLLALQSTRTGFDTRNVLARQRAGHVLRPHARTDRAASTRKRCGGSRSCRAWSASPSARSCRGAMRARSAPASSSRSRATRRRTAKRIRARRFRTVSPGFFDVARRADHRRPRFQRRRSPRRGAGRDRQPEPGAAHVPEPGRGQPAG